MMEMAYGWSHPRSHVDLYPPIATRPLSKRAPSWKEALIRFYPLGTEYKEVEAAWDHYTALPNSHLNQIFVIHARSFRVGPQRWYRIEFVMNSVVGK